LLTIEDFKFKVRPGVSSGFSIFVGMKSPFTSFAQCIRVTEAIPRGPKK
jgi:hypothetical protein